MLYPSQMIDQYFKIINYEQVKHAQSVVFHLLFHKAPGHVCILCIHPQLYTYNMSTMRVSF